MKPYAGWNIVAAATLVTLLTVGLRMGIGPFFLPMTVDLGWSRSLLAGIVAIGMLCYGLGMPLAGYVRAGTIALSSAILADVYGVRLVGILYGFAYLGHQVGGTISLWLGGWAFEAFGTHWVSFGSAAVLLLLAAGLSLRLPPQAFTLRAGTAAAPSAAQQAPVRG